MGNRCRCAPRASDPPTIASVVLNDVVYDDRVMRVASTLAARRARVTVLGVTAEKSGWEKMEGGVRVRVIAVPFLRFRVVGWVIRLLHVLEDLRERIRRGSTGSTRPPAGRTPGSPAEPKRLSARLDQRILGRRRRRVHARLSRELGRLHPAAIHANDADGLAVAVAARRALKGRPPIIYDAHEWAAGRETYGALPPGLRSELELEQELIGEADAVVTVTRRIAEMLRNRYRLPTMPGTLHNAPRLSAGDVEAPPLRELTQAPHGSPLLVYVGGIAPVRGILDVVAALPLLSPEVRFAALGMGTMGFKEEIREEAARLRVSERVHLVDPVPPELIVSTIRDATLGLMPFRRNPNYDLALPNKLFQYLHAGLPMVVSDCAAIAEFISGHQLGEVFTAEDPQSLAAAVRRAMGRIDELRERANDPELRRRFSWEAQEGSLLEIYSELGVLPSV